MKGYLTQRQFANRTCSEVSRALQDVMDLGHTTAGRWVVSVRLTDPALVHARDVLKKWEDK